MAIFLKVPKWRLKLAKNALKCVTLPRTAPLPASCTFLLLAMNGTVLACVTHFNAFLVTFGRHFETFKKMAAFSVFQLFGHLSELNLQKKFQILVLSLKNFLFFATSFLFGVCF